MVEPGFEFSLAVEPVLGTAIMHDNPRRTKSIPYIPQRVSTACQVMIGTVVNKTGMSIPEAFTNKNER